MAGLKFTLEADVKKLQELRKEIEKVTVAIGKLPSDSPQIRKLEAQLSKLRKEYDGIETLLSKVQLMGKELAKSEDLINHTRKQTDETKKATEFFVAEAGSLKLLEKQAKSLTKEWLAMSVVRRESEAGRNKMNEIAKISAQIDIEKNNLRSLQKEYINAQKIQELQEGSIKSLRAELSNLNAVYDSLSRSQRKGVYGKELLNGIQAVNNELIEAERASGRFQRTVGQYERAWDGLGYQIQTISREIPNFFINFQTGIVSLTNNIPYLADEIQKARIEYQRLKAEGQTAIPVWKQITKSVMSPQTALIAAISLFTLYRQEISEWVKSLSKAKNATDELLSAESEMAVARKNARDSIAKEQAQLDILYNKLKNVALSTTERNTAVHEWVKNYKTHSDILDGEKVSIDKLQQSYAALSKEIYNRAVAEKYADRIAELSVQRDNELIKAQVQYATYLESVNKYNKSQEDYNKKEIEGFGTATEKISAKSRIEDAKREMEAEHERWKDLRKNVALYDESITTISNHIKAENLFPQPKKGTYDYWQQQVEIADNALKQIQDSYLKVLKSGSTQGVPEEVAKQYNALIKQKTEAEEKLKIYDDKGLSKEYNSIVDQNQKISDLMDKQSIERKRREEDLEYQAAQAKINAMADGEDKIRAQRELDNKKEIQDLERQREDYIRTEIELQRKAFDEQESLREKQTNNYKKKTFDASTVKVDTSAFDKIINNTILRQDIYPYQEEMKYWNEYLKEYGTFQQKKAAINEEYNLKISEATTKGAKKSLEKEKENKLKEVSFEELKSSINFANIFGNLDAQSTEALVKMRDNLKEVINKAAKDIKPTDLKALQDAFKEIDLKITVRNPLGELKNSADNYRNATSAVIKAQEDLNTVIQGGEVITKVYTDENGKLTTRLLTLTQAENNLAAAQSDRQKALSKLTQAANSIGQKGMEVVNAGNDVVGMLENFGVKVPEAISKTLDGIGQVMSGLERIDLTKPFSAITGAFSVLAGVGNTIAGLFGFGGADYSRYNEMVDEYNKLNEIWDELIDKKKEYIDMSYGPEAAKAGDEAIEIANKSIESYKILGRERLQSGASAGSHSIGVRIRNSMSQELWDQWDEFAKSIGKDPDFIGGRLSGLFNLTAEQLEKLKEEAPGFWSKLDGDVQNYLNKIIEGGERIEDIQKAVQEQLTQTSFDSLFDNFIDTLMDMDASSKDFADNFGEYMRKAVFTQMFAKGYEDELRKWYESFSEAMGKEGGITSSDIKDLREGWDTIVNGALEDRKAWEQIVGGGGTSTSQESSKKGFATMSQDSADELNGRFTALQIAGEEIKNQSVEQTRLLDSINSILLNIEPSQTSVGIPNLSSTIDGLREGFATDIAMRSESNAQLQAAIVNLTGEVQTIKNNVSEMLTISTEDRLDQQTIAENSSNLNKNLPKITQTLDGIKQNTSGLSHR